MAETKTINLEVDTNLGSLKSQLRQAQAQVAALSDQFGVTSKQAAEAAKRAAELKDRIADAKDLTDAFNPDAKFNALSRSIGGALNGFQAFEGAMGLLGVESESLQKSLLKVQSAMALSQGLQGVLEAKDSFVQLGAVAKNALSGIRAGIAATGIGLFVVALGTIVAYWDDIKEAVSGVSEEQEKLNAKTDANVIAQQAKYNSIAGQENILKLQGKSEREILQIKQAQVEAVIKATEVQLLQQEATKKSQIEATKRNYDILKAITKIGIESSVLAFRALAAPIDAVLETANAVADALGFDKITTTNLNKEISKLTETASEAVTKFIFDPKEVESEGNKTIQATNDKLNALKNEAAGFQLAINDINKATVDKSGKETVKAAMETVQAFNEAAIDINEIDKQYYEDMKARDLEDLARMEADNQLIVDAHAELQQDLTDATLTRIDIEEAAEAEKQRKFKEGLKTSVELSIRGLNLIASIAEMNAGEDVKRQKRAFNIRKAANIASATMDGYNAVLSTFAETKGGIVLKSIAATIAGGFAALQIAGIAKTQFEGGGGSPNDISVPSVGGGAQAPSFNVVGNSGMNQLAQIQQTPIQAYVVSGEVTSAQALDRNRVKNATL